MKKFRLTKIICSACVLAALLPSAAAEALTVISGINISGGHEYKALRLIPPIYNEANRDLSDILIYDEAENAVPYFINSFESISEDRLEAVYPLALANSFVKDGDTYFDYYTEFDENKDIQATSISVRTGNASFAKSVELLGGYDGVSWDKIGADTLYRVEEAEKLSITFGAPQKYTYYRFKILKNAEKIAFDSVFLEYNENTVNTSFFTEALYEAPGEFDVEELERSTLIKLYRLKNVKINEITLDTNDRFKRVVRFADGNSKTLYNLSFGGGVYRDTTLGFGGYGSSSDVLEILIENGDDKPVKIDGVSISYFADEVIFKGENGAKYSLSFGDATVSRAPVYDIANYRELILKEGYDVLPLDNVSLYVAEPEPQKPDYSTAFNAVVVLVSVLLGVVILVRIRR